jgi:hypothetical protein
MTPPIHTEDPTAIHDRGIREIDDMTQKGENDTILTNWYIHPMVKNGPTLMAFIVRKQMRLVMYVLCWQQMGSILMD